MGTIDSTHFRLTCPNCGEMEVLSASESGSAWGSSGWSSLPSPVKFKAEIDQIETGSGPEVRSARCVSCGTPAKIENQMYNKPANW